jgi:hypothetical protein
VEREGRAQTKSVVGCDCNAVATTTEFGADGPRSTVFPPKGSDESFAERIRLGPPHGCYDDFKVEVRERVIQTGRENCVVLVEDKPAGMARWYSFAQLLESPCGSWFPRKPRKGGHSSRRGESCSQQFGALHLVGGHGSGHAFLSI